MEKLSKIFKGLFSPTEKEIAIKTNEIIDYINDNPVPVVNYKVYTAKIDTVIISTTSGTLVIGKTYVLAGVAAGDNFANVGYLANKVAFVATATTPTVWSNGTEVTNITDSQPTVIVLQDTFPGISVALETQITNALYNLTFRKSNVFILTKFFPTTSSSNFSRKSDSLLTADFVSNGYYEFKVYD